MTEFVDQVDALIAVTGEWTADDELIDATHRLRALAVEAEDVERRFHGQMDAVKQILENRLGRIGRR